MLNWRGYRNITENEKEAIKFLRENNRRNTRINKQ